LQEDLITTNIKKIDEAITDCGYIIDKAKVEKQYAVNPETNRKVLADYKVTVYPTKDFQTEQFRSNVHHKNITEHRTTQEGKAIIKPMRDQYPTRHDFKQFQNDNEQYKKSQ